MYVEHRYLVRNLDDGYDCAFYTHDINEWLQYKRDNQYECWEEVI